MCICVFLTKKRKKKTSLNWTEQEKKNIYINPWAPLYKLTSEMTPSLLFSLFLSLFLFSHLIYYIPYILFYDTPFLFLPTALLCCCCCWELEPPSLLLLLFSPISKKYSQIIGQWAHSISETHTTLLRLLTTWKKPPREVEERRRRRKVCSTSVITITGAGLLSDSYCPLQRWAQSWCLF